LIDSDSNPSTGYASHGLGAEYLVDLQGGSGKVINQKLYEFDPTTATSNIDWSGWEYKSNVNIGLDKYRVEGELVIPYIENLDTIQGLIITQDYFGNSDLSDNIISPAKNILSASVVSSPSILISNGVENHVFMTLELQSEVINSDEVLINKLEIELLGNAGDSALENMKLIIPNKNYNADILEADNEFMEEGGEDRIGYGDSGINTIITQPVSIFKNSNQCIRNNRI